MPNSAGEGPYSVSVLGDLHLEPAQMHLFHEARQQLVQAMSGDSDGVVRQGARVVQLGDLGGYKHRPGWYGGSAAHPGTSVQDCRLQAADKPSGCSLSLRLNPLALSTWR